MLAGAEGIAGDDRNRTLLSDVLAQVVGVIGGIGDDDPGWQLLDQRGGLRRIAAMPRRSG